jgi:hypothetical protein
MPQCMSRDPRKRRVCILASSNGARQPRHGCRRRPEVAARMRRPQQVVAAGKFPKDRIGFWVDACKRDRPKNRAIIKVLASGILPPPAEKVAADGDLTRVHNKVMAQLGIPTEPRRSVAASSGFGAQPGESLPAAYRMPDMPAPVVIQKGCIAGRLDSEAGPRCQAQKPWAAVLSRHTKTTGWRRGLLPIAQRCLAFR